MTDLVISPKTKQDIEAILKARPQSLLIVGSSGIGKQSIAELISEQLLEIESLDSYPYALSITPEEGKSIGIEAVRSLEHFLSLKVPINKSPNRVALILGSDKLTQEAQNALLKTLEEPPKDTVIILTAAFDGLLLPTIRSRVQILHVVKPDESLLREHFNSSDEQNFNRAYLISGGLPGLLSALLQNEDHPLISATDNAREILSKNQYERLLLINDLSKDTTKLLNTLQIMEQMARISLSRGASPQQWTKVLDASYEAYKDILMNAQTKLTLLKLMFSL